jgi:hypothetical protein
MKRKELNALFNEICSRVHPIRGIYQEGASERERIIQRELENFKERSLEHLEKEALEGIFLSSLDKLDTEDALTAWYQAINKFYPPEKIPDTVYIRLMAIASQKKFQSMKKLLEKQKQ